MKPLQTVYWIKFALGFVAALACLGYGIGADYISRTKFEFNFFLSSASIAIVIYFLSYYLIKYRFASKVATTRKLVMTGIGVYFLSWIVFWVILYTIFAGA